MSEPLVTAIERHLHALGDGHPDRHIGRPGNIAAVDYAEPVLQELHWIVDAVELEALDCETGPASLDVGGRSFEVHPGPCTVPADVTGPLVPIATVAALDEAGAPGAVIGATGRGGGMGGALYPYPPIEGGDFDIANAFTTDVIGAELAELAGQEARLTLVAGRKAVQGRQLTATRGPAGAPRAVVIAHIDSKGGSPAALDNAGGVAALLGVARLLEDYDGPYQVELIPMHGEDYYASSGEHFFVEANEGRWDELMGTVNMDAIGAHETPALQPRCTPSANAAASSSTASFVGMTP